MTLFAAYDPNAGKVWMVGMIAVPIVAILGCLALIAFAGRLMAALDRLLIRSPLVARPKRPTGESEPPRPPGSKSQATPGPLGP